jgi:preprotein translocase subunit SecD
MRYFGWFLVSVSLGIGQASLGQAQAVLSMHRTCITGGVVGEKLFLRYWPAPPDNGIPEPVCVAKTPALEGLPIRSAHVEPDRRSGLGAIVVVEFDDTARPLIEKMSRDNVGKMMAVVVGDRIVSMPVISRSFSDNKLPISASSNGEVKRILSAVSPAAEGKK